MNAILEIKRRLAALWSNGRLRAIVAGLLMLPPLLLLSALVLMPKSSATDFEKALNEVAALKRIDATWNYDSLRLLAGLIVDYDPLTAPLPSVAAGETALRSLVERWGGRQGVGWGQELPSLMEGYREAMVTKLNLLERIKSEHSIFSNSGRYLPTAYADLSIELRAQEATVDRGTLELVNQIMVDVLSVSRGASPDLQRRIEERLARLKMASSGWPSEMAWKVDIVISHTKIMMKQRLLSDALLKEMLATPTASWLDSIANAFQQGKMQDEQRQQRYKTLLMGYVGLLLTVLCLMGWLLARSYRSLNSSNLLLREANEEAQLQIIQSAKMAAMGRMAAGLAHEINTPLAYVRATVAVLKEKLIDEKACPSHLSDEFALLIEDGLYGIDQISKLVLTLKNFSRLDQARVAEFSVEEGLDNALLLARYTLKHVAQVQKEYGNVRRISCSPAQLNQVFLNIIVNASHAMACREGKGLLVVRTSEEDGWVRMDIQDNGTGIPKNILPKIFDPFFTTKKIGEGSGTGLALSYRIVQNHRGSIKVETQEGVGTTFIILLPVSAHEGVKTMQSQLETV